MSGLPKYVKIDGSDYISGTLIKKIYVWKNYENRQEGCVKSLIFKKRAICLRHGKKVRLISKKGRRLKIKISWGRIGYISDWFTKEFKNG